MFLDNLKNPTPDKNVRRWSIGTLLYFLACFIDTNYGLLCRIAGPEFVDWLKLVGALAYAYFTFTQFNKSMPNENNPR